MSNIIGADAAKLAGLQIDLLQKIRHGSLTVDQMKWWLSLNSTTRNHHMEENIRMTPCYEAPNGEFFPTPEHLVDEFSVLVDLGIITVPNDYVHKTQLEKFDEQNYKDLYYYFRDRIGEDNFPNPTRILKPGDKLHVRVFEPAWDKVTITLEECLMFLSLQKAVHTGAPGASLVYSQRRDQIEKGKWYCSLDEKDHLWTYSVGHYGVAGIHRNSDDSFWFHLVDFEHVCNHAKAILCFTEVECDETEKS